jgi:hypothetical protein
MPALKTRQNIAGQDIESVEKSTAGSGKSADFLTVLFTH